MEKLLKNSGMNKSSGKILPLPKLICEMNGSDCENPWTSCGIVKSQLSGANYIASMPKHQINILFNQVHAKTKYLTNVT